MKSGEHNDEKGLKSRIKRKKTQHLRKIFPKGCLPLLDSDAALYNELQSKWFDRCKLFGFSPVSFPPVISAGLLSSNNAAHDRIYSFKDKGQRDLALVSDSLPVLTALVAQIPFNQGVRWSYHTDVFRYIRKPRRHWHFLGVFETFPFEIDGSEVTQLLQLAHGVLNSVVEPVYFLNDHKFWKSIVSKLDNRDDVSKKLSKSNDKAVPTFAELMPNFATPALHTLERIAGWRLCDIDYAELRIALETLDAENTQSFLNYLLSIPEEMRPYCRFDPYNFHAFEFQDGPMAEIYDANRTVRLGDAGTYSSYVRNEYDDAKSAFGLVIVPDRVLQLVEEKNKCKTSTLIVCEPKFLESARSIAMQLREVGEIVEVLCVGDLKNPSIAKYARKHDVQRRCIVGSPELPKNWVAIFDVNSGWSSCAADSLQPIKSLRINVEKVSDV